MIDLVIKVAGIIVTFISTIVKIIEMLQKTKEKHQKSNRPDQE